MRHSRTGSGKRYPPRGIERKRNTPVGRFPKKPSASGTTAPASSPLGMSSLSVQSGFAASLRPSPGPARPMPGFAAAMGRGSRDNSPGSLSGRSDTLDAVLRTVQLGLRDGH